MKIYSLILLTLILTSNSAVSQLQEINSFTESLVTAFFKKDTETLRSMVATHKEIKPLMEDLYLKEEDLNEYKKEIKEFDLFKDPQSFWEDLEDIIFFYEDSVLFNLDHSNFKILHTMIIESESGKNGIVEIYLDVIVESNNQFFMFEFGELIYTKELGFKFFDYPDVELLTEEVWSKENGFNLTTHLYKEDAINYLNLHIKKDSIALKKHKNIEKTYLKEGQKTTSVAKDIRYFWKELNELKITAKDFETSKIIGYVAVKVQPQGKNAQIGILYSLLVKNHIIFFSIDGTYYQEEKYNLDYWDIDNVVKLVD